MSLHLLRLRERLNAGEIPSAAADESLATRRAAVAAVLRGSEHDLEVLLMKRAVHQQDKWSGHVAMPGGREEGHDPALLDTAIRETHEEVGVDLRKSASFLGHLDPVRAVAGGRILSMTITPFVFQSQDLIQPRISVEAQEVFWFPLSRAARGEFDGRYPYRHKGQSMELPCWNFEAWTVWGLTYRMLSDLIDLMRDPKSG